MGCCSGHLVIARLMKRYRRLAKLCTHPQARLTKPSPAAYMVEHGMYDAWYVCVCALGLYTSRHAEKGIVVRTGQCVLMS